MGDVWVWPSRPLAEKARERIGSHPGGVVTQDEPGRARNIRVTASAASPGQPITVSSRRHRYWSTFEYYCPSEADQLALQRLGLDPGNPSWAAVEAELVAAGIPDGDVRQLSGPAAIRMLTRLRAPSTGGDPPLLDTPPDLINHERAAEIAEVSAGTVRRWLDQNRLSFYGEGRRVSEAELREKLPTLRQRKPRTSKRGRS